MWSKNQGSQHTWTVPCCESSASPPGWSESFACCVNIWQVLVQPVREKPRVSSREVAWEYLSYEIPEPLLNSWVLRTLMTCPFWGKQNKTKKAKHNFTKPFIQANGPTFSFVGSPWRSSFHTEENLSWLWARHFMFFVLPVPQGGLRYFFFFLFQVVFLRIDT